MRVGMLTDIYKPRIGGVTNYVALTKRILEDEHEDKVFVFTLGDMEYEDDELRVIRSPGLVVHEKSGYSLGLRYRRLARRKLTTMDIAHVHHPFISGRLAVRYAKPVGIPVVFTNHTRYDIYATEYIPFIPAGVSEAFLKTYMPAFCDDVDLVVAPSPGVEAVLRDLGVTADIQVIPNGVDLTDFQQPKAVVPRESLGLSDDDVVVIYVGRLGPEKNLTFLLRAFASAQSVADRLRLVIVGDGVEGDNLRDRVQLANLTHKVAFTGPVDYSAVPGYLAMADVFATASKSEVHSLALIEGMATGLAGLGIRSPGVEDTIQDGENGFLCEDDLAEFTGRLIKLGLDDDLRRRFQATARASAAQFDVRRTTAQLREAYERLLAEHERPSRVRRMTSGIRNLLK